MGISNGEWKVNQAKFQGYMKASIENIDKKLDKHGEIHKEFYNKHEEHEREIITLKTNWKYVAAGISTGVSIVVGFFVAFFKALFGKS